MSGRHPNFMLVRMGRVFRLGCWEERTWISVLSEFTLLALQLPMVGERESQGKGGELHDCLTYGAALRLQACSLKPYKP